MVFSSIYSDNTAVEDLLTFGVQYNQLYTKASTYLLIVTDVYLFIVTDVYLFITFRLDYKTPISERVANRWFLSAGNPITPEHIHYPDGFVSIPGGRVRILETHDTTLNL